MKRVLELEKEYKCNATKAIEKFFKAYPEQANIWQETFEWMNENNVENFCDNRFADGTKNNDWAYSLWLDKLDDKNTYICLIERA